MRARLAFVLVVLHGSRAMVTLSPQDINLIIEQLVQAGYRVERDMTREGPHTLLDERHF